MPSTLSTDSVATLLAVIRSELLPTIIALILVGAYVWLIISSVEVPGGLEVLVGAVVAFYYQARNTQAVATQAATLAVNGHELRAVEKLAEEKGRPQ